MNNQTCSLPEDLPCPHRSDKTCTIVNTKCGFYEEAKSEVKYERKEKWFEKYYRK
ncbi:MAG: hypothetical protein Q4G60_03150 [bacterium]|nr:hypothetical protein [bacterium]